MNDDIHSQAYLYVVGALSPEETREYEAHLSTCPECQKEVADMRQLTAELSQAVDADPPATLRTSLLAQIAQTPQESPAGHLTTAHTSEVDAPAAAGSQPAEGVVRAPGRHAAPVDIDESGTDKPGADDEVPSNVVPIRRSWSTKASAAVAAVAVLAAAIVGGWAISERNDAQDEADLANQQVAELTEVLTSPDVEAASAVVAGGGTASVVRSASQEAALLVAVDLPSLPSGKVYEAWTIKGKGDPVPAGTFETQGAQTTFALTPAALEAGAVALSVEPTGGSDQPTTPPIVAIELPTT